MGRSVLLQVLCFAEVAAQTEISWIGVTALSVNTNGIKKNGHFFIEHLLSKYSISCIQETKFRDQTQFSTFKFHLDASFQHKVFVSDDNSTHQHTTSARSAGVATLVRADFPGYESADLCDTLTIPNQYLVIRFDLGGAPLYVHNVYAPVDQQEKQHFFAQLNAAQFEVDASHIVMGDFNLSMDPVLDATTVTTHSDQARPVCLEWLATLGVLDAWRVEHDSERVYTGPQPRKNRLDYIFMSDGLFQNIYRDSKYFAPTHAGDHLAHSVVFRQGVQAHGRGYWKFPAYLLEYPAVCAAIEEEATEVLSKLRIAENPGRVWEKWKQRIKRLLRQRQATLRASNTALVDTARQALDTTATRYKLYQERESQHVFEQALREYHDCVARTSMYNQDTAFDFQAQYI